MIGFEYNGQVNYITRMEDFREYMEPSVYEALTKVLDGGLWDDDYKKMYEDLESEYESLERDYEELEGVSSEQLEDCETQLDDVTEKFIAFKYCIEKLINQYYQRYIKLEDVIPTLEKLIKE